MAAGIAGAIIGALLAFGGSWLLWRAERNARRQERDEDRTAAREEQRRREELEGQVAELRAEQVTMLARIAEATEQLRSPTPEELQARGATLSARFQRAGKNHRLIITNKGPGGAQLREVTLPETTTIITRGLVTPDAPVELAAGETNTTLAMMAGGTPHTVTVRMNWIDGTGEQTRDQSVSTL
jgi:hypothetical protein